MLTAELFPIKNLYNVVFDGELIVEASRDPETDLARALQPRGYIGTVTVLDGSTGKPRNSAQALLTNVYRSSRLHCTIMTAVLSVM